MKGENLMTSKAKLMTGGELCDYIKFGKIMSSSIDLTIQGVTLEELYCWSAAIYMKNPTELKNFYLHLLDRDNTRTEYLFHTLL